MKNTWYAIAATGLVGCAIQPSPNSVGNGRYLQILVGTQVTYEMDVVAAGHENCPTQAVFITQQNPRLTVRCAHEPTTQAMRYSFRAHLQSNVQDEIKPSSPYTVRLSTAEQCKSSANATRAQPKAVILEENCGSPASGSASGTTAATAPARPPAVPTTNATKTAASPAPAILPPAPPDTAAAARATTPGRDEAASLHKLKELWEKGLITQEEYDKKRKEILDRL